jgi:hypothetical protein
MLDKGSLQGGDVESVQVCKPIGAEQINLIGPAGIQVGDLPACRKSILDARGDDLKTTNMWGPKKAKPDLGTFPGLYNGAMREAEIDSS